MKPMFSFANIRLVLAASFWLTLYVAGTPVAQAQGDQGWQ